MSYKVLFIDEESIQHDNFKEHFEENWPEAECECVFPARTIEGMLELLEKTHPDAVIVDYQLNDKKVDISYNVGYNGVELLNAIHNQLADFPCFVITSYDGEAVVDSDDVNLVYCCSYVNRAKWDDDNPNYLDPCDVDFNLHFERDDLGFIKAKTPQGQYMVEHMNLGLTRYAICWNLDRLEEKIKILERKVDRNIATMDEKGLLLNVNKEFHNYLEYLRSEL